jgi:hypothetical protein
MRLDGGDAITSDSLRVRTINLTPPNLTRLNLA